MNGTKWYKLNKSNEPILITLHEELGNLENSISSDLSSALVTVAEIIFSGLLTFFIDRDIDLLSSYWRCMGISPSQSQILWGTVLSCAVVFLGTIGMCKLVVFIVNGIRKTFKDEKKTLLGIYQLERYFYQKVLNDIITGVSLEKKSCELLAGLDTSTSPVQDKDLSSIYLVEAVFYFHEAYRSIAEKQIFEVANPERENYTAFLNEINPGVVCNIFLMCEETLYRIINTLDAGNEQTIESAKKVYNLFVSCRRNIHKQLGLEPVTTHEFVISWPISQKNNQTPGQ